MPANGATIRGKPGPHITQTGVAYNPETGITTQDVEYSGSNLAISGLAITFANRNREHRGDYEGGLARLTVSTPVQSAPTLDKYEILWEMEQREIWSNPTVMAAAKAYDDALVNVGDQTFRDIAEQAVEGKIGLTPTGVMAQVIANLRAGYTGYEQEFIVLRRTRTLPPDEISPMNLSAASLIYTGAQLLLPADVLFVLPNPAVLYNPDPDNFLWGWRRRPSSCTIQGQSAEQTSEFLLAMWSLLDYAAATENADW